MSTTFTHNLLIRKLYGELNEREQQLLNETLASHWQLIEDLESYGEVVKQLNAQTFSPTKTSVDIVMAHSKKTAPVGLC